MILQVKKHKKSVEMDHLFSADPSLNTSTNLLNLRTLALEMMTINKILKAIKRIIVPAANMSEI